MAGDAVNVGDSVNGGNTITDPFASVFIAIFFSAWVGISSAKDVSESDLVLGVEASVFF